MTSHVVSSEEQEDDGLFAFDGDDDESLCLVRNSVERYF
jgi:hypothetical protein